MEWHRLRAEPGCEGTAATYLDMLLVVEGWRLAKGYRWDAPPAEVRSQIREFLRERLACAVVGDGLPEGYRVAPSGKTPLAPSTIRILLAALTSLYDVLGAEEVGLYAHPNPLTSQTLLRWRRAHLQHVAGAGAPDVAGIRGETHGQSKRRPVGYFRLPATVWSPDFPMEPAEIRTHLYRALVHMIRMRRGITRRDRVILLLLLLTGARVGEIVRMTMGGYLRGGCRDRAYVTNKGSFGRAVKRIDFGGWAATLLEAYIREERACHDPYGRGRRWPDDAAQFDQREPLFLTRGGQAYTPTAFRHHWRRLRARVRRDLDIPFSFRIHDIRHLVVTEWRARNKQAAAGNAAQERRLNAGLQGRIMWHSAETVKAYDHAEDMGAAFDALASGWFAELRDAVGRPGTRGEGKGPDGASATRGEGRPHIEDVYIEDPYSAVWREDRP